MSLKTNSQANAQSKLKSLKSILDSKRIVNFGSRIASSRLSYNSKFPIIKPATHRLTQLIMNYYHRKIFQFALQALLNTIRKMFWPISSRNLARKVIHQCLQCFKHRPMITERFMGNLPVQWVMKYRVLNRLLINFDLISVVHYL